MNLRLRWAISGCLVLALLAGGYFLGRRPKPPKRYVAPVHVGEFGKRPRNKALADAIDSDDVPKVLKLLESGVSADCVVDAPQHEGRTELELASGKGNFEMVKLLLDYGADVNGDDEWGGTPLTEASAEGNAEVVELLLARGANVDASDDGANALGYASYQILDPKDPKNPKRDQYVRIVDDLRKAGATYHLPLF